MSRNLTSSYCVECDNDEPVRLSDLMGKPIEFRAAGNSPPEMGTKWNCPQCDRAYFVVWRPAKWSSDWRWSEHENADWFKRYNQNRTLEEAKEQAGVPQEVDFGWTAGFVLDLSYYESYNDEPGQITDERRCLVEDNREEWQWVW